MKMTDKEMEMMEQLEEAREMSEDGSHTIAMGNGEGIVWFFGGVENTDDCINFLRECGYWIVNQFINGQPVGIGV